MPKISVLMPVFNTKEEYLRKAIESILNQTYKDFEFIVINDGSTNNAKEVILSYGDSRIKYYEQSNQGLIATLNRGLTLCQGEYIARMDSDDISLPDRFKKQVEVLDNNHDIGICGAFLKTFQDFDWIYNYKERPKYLDMLKSCQLGHPVVMLRKSVLDKYGLKYENFLHAEDYELWSRLIKYTAIYNIQEVLLYYRINQSSISVKYADIQKNTDLEIKNKMLDFLTDDGRLQSQIMDLLNSSQKMTYTFWERIFSIKNTPDRLHKVVTILWIKFKLKKENNF